MNVSTAKKLETRENFFAPVIVSTTPVKRKELDLTFVHMVQRKRNALDYIAKIKAKHVDFVLCNPDNLAVKFILELEDSTHYSAQRAERDDFVDKVLKKCGYKIVHTYGEANLDELIQRLLK